MKYKVTIDDKTYEVVIEDLRSRPIVAYVGGEAFEIFPEVDLTPSPGAARPAPARQVPARPAAASPAASTSASASSAPTDSAASLQTVRAPIPGVITAVNVQPGDAVAVGQQICSLEAMKMNNSIRASRAGKIAAVLISVGQHVKHGETMAEFED